MSAKPPIFSYEDATMLFRNKMVVLIGDSVMRAAYKDLVMMLALGRRLHITEMRRRGEDSFCGDKLVEGGTLDRMHNGKDYREVRQYQAPTHLIRFYFVTRAYGPYVETILADLAVDPRPDVVVAASCVWDMTRYGPRGMERYRPNLESLCRGLRQVLQPHALFIWATTLPVGEHVNGGVILDNIRFLGETLRLDVLLANYMANEVMSYHGFDVIDFHSMFRTRVNERLCDGIHWSETAHRIMTFMLIDHVRIAWHIPPSIEQFVRNLIPR